MNIHEFGTENERVVVLLHPLGVWWDVFSEVIDILEQDYHLVVPAMPGHDPDDPESDFISVGDVVSRLTDHLLENGMEHVTCLYGCSMGGACVTGILAEGRIQTDCAVIDGGITPYRLPKPVTYLIGIRDFCMAQLGKHLSLNALKSVFDPDKYDEEDLGYIKKVLSSMSGKTIWNGFYSANNYRLPDIIHEPDCPLEYWYGEKEKKARKWDIAFIGKLWPQTRFVELKDQDHAEFFTLHPEEFCRRLRDLIGKGTER